MPYDDHRYSCEFGIFDEFCCTFSYLGDTSCRGLYIVRVEGLYGVYDKDFRIKFFYLLEDVLGLRLSKYIAVVASIGDTLPTHFDLLLAFFARYIQGFVGHAHGNL